MDKILLSIGHSQHTVDFFIRLLEEHNVNYILGVRSTPYSQFASEYNRENIKTILERNRIAYTFNILVQDHLTILFIHQMDI